MESHAAAGGPRAYPLAEAIARLGIKPTKGAELIRTGELKSFTIGRNRFVDAGELARFIQERIAKAAAESAADRAAKTAAAVQARARKRKERTAAATA